MINDVLDVSRLEGGLVTIEARPENMQDVAEAAIKLVPLHDQRRIEIAVPADLPSLQVDTRRLAQALGNLLANALKFTPEAGRICLAARLQPDGGVHLLVEDTGIGMAGKPSPRRWSRSASWTAAWPAALKALGWACTSPRRWPNCMAAR